MEYIQLGNSDLKVSRICLGCMGFGDVKNSQHTWTIDEQHTREIVKKALDMGITFFDIDIAYQSGTSEQYLGRALKIIQIVKMLLSQRNCIMLKEQSKLLI